MSGTVIDLDAKRTRPEGRCWCGWKLPAHPQRHARGLRAHLADKSGDWFEITCPDCGEEFRVGFTCTVIE